jgi:carboxymethylenebutenolidase
MGEMITLKGPDGFEFGCYRAAPQGERKGGVIVVQEIFGLNKTIIGDADRWAALGYEAVAPSLFDRAEKGFIGSHADETRAKGLEYMKATSVDQALGDVAAVRDYLAAKGDVFIVGYCWGGSIAWLAASRVAGLKAAASYYGGMVRSYLDIPLACPVIMHLGSEDKSIPATELKAELQAAHPDVPVHVYEGAGHAFSNDSPDRLHPEAAALARQRTIDFFRTAQGA